MEEAFNMLRSLSLSPTEWNKHGIQVNSDGLRRSAFEVVSKYRITWNQLSSIWPQLHSVQPAIQKQAEIEAFYHVYLERQKKEIDVFQKDYNLKLPMDIDYSSLIFLSNEEKEKLSKTRPTSIWEASKISGITPSALISLLQLVKRSRSNESTTHLELNSL
jgi:tRNA uridine 5-carboxymethylaminomethyl modification enzyme